MSSIAKFDIRKLLLEDGSCPFDTWFARLPAQMQHAIDTRLLRVRLGNFGEINTVGAGVWELKFRIGAGIRIYYSQIGRNSVILLIGGKKSSQTKDILAATKLFGRLKRGELSNA